MQTFTQREAGGVVMAVVEGGKWLGDPKAGLKWAGLSVALLCYHWPLLAFRLMMGVYGSQ